MTTWQVSLDDPLAWQIYGDDPTDYVVEVGAANLGLYAKLASPAFTGVPTGPTAAPATNTTQLATTAFVIANAGGGGGSVSDTAFAGSWDGVTTIAPSKNAVYDKITAVEAGLGIYAPLASPALTGNPTAPTASPGDSDTSIATTAFVSAAITAQNLSATYAPLASPALTGNPTAPTATPGDNDTSIATTAFVSAAITALVSDTAYASSWNGATAAAPSQNAVYDVFEVHQFGAAKISGNWLGLNHEGAVASGTALTANTIYLVPFVLWSRTSLTDLAARVSTLSAGGNFQLAIYANNAATGRPTGNSLGKTGSLTTAATGGVSGVLDTTPLTLLAPGLYWLGINQDNSTSGFMGFATTNAPYALTSIIGDATLGNVMLAGSNNQFAYLTVAQTYGTWPDLTGGSFTIGTAGTRTPFIWGKVA